MTSFTEEPGGKPAKTKPSATPATPPAAPAALVELDKLCLDYEEQSAKYDAQIAALEADLAEVRQRHVAALKRQAGVVANRAAAVQAAIEAAPDLFVKPRTLLLHGVKVGFKYNEGGIAFDDADEVVNAIKRHFKDRAEELIRVKEEPSKEAIGRLLTAAETAKIGCRVEGQGDAVVLKRVAGDVEKLFNKLIEKMVAAIGEG